DVQSHAQSGASSPDDSHSYAQSYAPTSDDDRSHAQSGASSPDDSHSYAQSYASTSDDDRSHAQSGASSLDDDQSYAQSCAPSPDYSSGDDTDDELAWESKKFFLDEKTIEDLGLDTEVEELKINQA
ncbi:hypothetical protein C0992_011257, partial [Termitomyces sp. T32_za158]